MMKPKILFIFVFCLVVGFSLSVQAKVLNGQHLFVSAKAITDLKTTIESEHKDTERVRKLLAEAKISLSDYQKANPSHEIFTLKLSKERDYYKMISGGFDIKGPGVVVTIDDGTRALFEGEDPNNVLVHDADILIIINELKSAGAEAIAINGQRIVDASEIACSGYTVRINGQFFARPFKIEAIGDSARMLAILVAPESYGVMLKDYGLNFNPVISDEVFIPKYIENINYKYMKKS